MVARAPQHHHAEVLPWHSRVQDCIAVWPLTKAKSSYCLCRRRSFSATSVTSKLCSLISLLCQPNGLTTAFQGSTKQQVTHQQVMPAYHPLA